MEKIVFLVLFSVTFLIGCNAQTQNNTSNTSIEISSENNSTQYDPHRKLSLTSKSILETNFNTLSGREYKVSDWYDEFLKKSEFKIEVIQSQPIVFALFTKNGEENASGLIIFSSFELANNTVVNDYKKLVSTLESLLPTIDNETITKKITNIEGIDYTTYVFENDLPETLMIDEINTAMDKQSEKISSQLKEEKKDTNKIDSEHVNALIKAEQYIKSSNFSKKSLYNQLLFEKFSEDSAQYAVNTIKVNWKEQALEKAKSYQEISPMSIEELKNQLTSENGEYFTQEEADYAIQHLFK